MVLNQFVGKLSWDGGTIYLYFPYFPFLISLYCTNGECDCLLLSLLVWVGLSYHNCSYFVSLAVDLELFETKCARVGRLTCVIGDHDS